ncbi:MAG: VCBS repeat-containing protein, partial [bacterium]
YALDGRTGQDRPGCPYVLPGWPEDPYMKPYAELVVADLDGDGTPEVLCEVTDNNSVRKCGSALYCFSASGDSLWKYWFYQDTLDRHGQWTKPAVADLDGDGRLEIVCHEAKFNGRNPWNLLERRLFILNYDGTLRRSVRTEGQGSSFTPDYAAPVVADLDQDGTWEIVILRRPGFLEVIDTTLNRVTGWPADLTADAGYTSDLFTRCFSTPAVADIDGDGDLEIVVGSFGLVGSPADWGGHIHAFHHTGAAVTGFPYETRNGVWYSPGLADLDGQPGLEILTAACDSAMYIVTNTGDSLPGWPRRGFPTYWLPDEGNHAFIEGRIPMSKTPQLCDVDGDSLIEMLMNGRDERLYVLNTSGPWNPEAMPLPTFHYDKWRTGWYRLSPTGVAEERPTHHSGRITPNATVVRGVLDLPGSSFGIRNSSLIDAAGRRVLDLAPGANDVSRLAPGVYFIHSTIDTRHSGFSRVVIAR